MVKGINGPCDWFFNVLGIGSHESAWTFQLFLCVLNVTLSAWPVFCFVVYAADVHTTFWLGEAAQYVSLLVPVVLLGLNLGVQIFFSAKAKPDHARIGCFLLFTVLGSVLLGAGIYVSTLAEGTSADLVQHCGTTPLTSRLELEWQKLDRFYQDCDPLRKTVVTACPGFDREFPKGRERVMVDYLETLEADYNCVGFCQFWAKPIFQGDAGHLNVQAPRCASSLGFHLQATAYTVGGPASALGLALLLVGLCLSGYDHL